MTCCYFYIVSERGSVLTNRITYSWCTDTLATRGGKRSLHGTIIGHGYVLFVCICSLIDHIDLCALVRLSESIRIRTRSLSCFLFLRTVHRKLVYLKVGRRG